MKSVVNQHMNAALGGKNDGGGSDKSKEKKRRLRLFHKSGSSGPFSSFKDSGGGGKDDQINIELGSAIKRADSGGEVLGGIELIRLRAR